MAISKEMMVRYFHIYKEKIIQMQRFKWWFKLLCLLPTILWFAEFNLSKHIPADARPEVDTTTLPYLDSRILFGYTLLHWPRNALEGHDNLKGFIYIFDLLSAFVYVIHFCFAWIFSLLVYLYLRRKTDSNGKPLTDPWAFLWCLGLLNFTAVTLQLCWPTAPPWYVELYGTKPPSYGMHGDPAGLENADAILHIPLFGSIYGNSPIVFGSFPSLHGAWPIMITMFTPPGKAFKIAGATYAGLVWWAAMYLNHHFLTDLIGGLLFVLVNYFGGLALLRLIQNYFKDRIYGPAANASSYKDAPGLELVVVSDEDVLLDSDEESSLPRSPKIKKIPSRDENNSFVPLLDENSLRAESFKLNEKHL